jgi:carbon monoxide dehydrogenase subunit G
MPDTFTCERSTHVDAPPEAIYARLVDFHRWRSWSPFEGLDPNMERTYSGARAGVGAIYEWAGNMKSGTGRMEMVEAEPDRRIVIDQQNLKPMKSRCTVTFTLTEDGGGTAVGWRMDGRTTGLARVMSKVRSMDSLIGPVFEKGLANLRAECEGAPAEAR